VIDDVERAQAELELNHRIDTTFYRGEAVNIQEMEDENRTSFFTFHQTCCLKRWNELYDPKAHLELRDAIIQQLTLTKNESEN
jgi:hypothetical protein